MTASPQSRLSAFSVVGTNFLPESDPERAGDFTKGCFLGLADLNASAKQTSALGRRLGGLLADLT